MINICILQDLNYQKLAYIIYYQIIPRFLNGFGLAMTIEFIILSNVQSYHYLEDYVRVRSETAIYNLIHIYENVDWVWIDG